MASNSFDVMDIVQVDDFALAIAAKYDEWCSAMGPWREQVKELRDYLYATDTKTTTNSKLPFKNSTTIPKLAQIRMNLIANYMSHLFPSQEWVNWVSESREGSEIDKKTAIESYIRTKTRMQNFEDMARKLLLDWVSTGNCFAQLVYVNETVDDPTTGEKIPQYIGPRLMRVSPFDIVFNINADSFKRSPKIIRKLYSLGELHRMAEENPEMGYTKDILDDIVTVRRSVVTHERIDKVDVDKARGITADGFGDIMQYYNTDLVEVLELYGDIYDVNNNVFYKDHVITVVDRRHVVRKQPINSWTGSSYLYHRGWEERPENLMGMGPLDNLVGMQYKIDKLENLRADVFDHIANPTTVEVGDVELYGTPGAPGNRYIVGEGGGVSYLQPDATALQADLQIAQTMQVMEEMAGSPRESMGFRSPGEKTKFEVQVLDNAANRIFRRKVEDFELFLGEILNDMLELARRNLDGTDLVRMEDPTFGIDKFLSVTKEDITARGKLRPVGSRHSLRKANLIQNLSALSQSPAFALMAPHFSRLVLAQLHEEAMDLEKFNVVAENVGVLEDVETQRVAQSGAAQLEEESATPLDPDEDI